MPCMFNTGCPSICRPNSMPGNASCNTSAMSTAPVFCMSWDEITVVATATSLSNLGVRVPVTTTSSKGEAWGKRTKSTVVSWSIRSSTVCGTYPM